MTLHLKAIDEEGELDEPATCKDCLKVRREGGREVSRKLRHDWQADRLSRAPQCGKLRCQRNRKRIAKIKLSDGKERTIQHMLATCFWHPDGTPMSAAQFMENFYGKGARKNDFVDESFNRTPQARAFCSDSQTRVPAACG